MGVFSDHAVDYTDHGVRVFPVTVEQDGDGWKKRPCIKNWRRRATTRPAAFSHDFPDAAIGILNDSAVTVVDLDEPNLVDWALERFGDTPVIIRTPRGGNHLWYQHNGERRLTGLDGRKVDILGTGGYAVVPPSTRPDGSSWEFLRGEPNDIGHLPKIPTQALPSVDTYNSGTISVGNRNKALFSHLLKNAPCCDNINILTDVAKAFVNEQCLSPGTVSSAEIKATVKKVWEYQVSDRNFCGRQAHVIVTPRIMDALTPHPDALALWCILNRNHGGRTEAFAVACKAMADAKIIPGWGPRRYRKALETLMTKGIVRRVYEGGNHRADPSLYVLV